MTLTFTVPGEPQGKQRPRHMKNGHTYTPDKTRQYENLVKMSFWEAFPHSAPIEKDVSLLVSITAYFMIPASVNKKRRVAMLGNMIRPTKKPDCDNIAKAVLDALNGIAYYDDSQIVTLTVDKLYSDMPRVEVEMEVVK